VTRKFLHNLTLLDPEAAAPRRAAVVLESGLIGEVLTEDAERPTDAEAIDLEGRALAPGFLDLHFHGPLIFTESGDLRRALRQTGRDLVRSGTTGYLATTVAWDDTRLREFMTQSREEMTHAEDASARLLGVHLEGPWISPEAAGAQPTPDIRPFSPKTDLGLLETGEGCLKMVTLAPEVEGAPLLLGALRERRIVAALGHSSANDAQNNADLDAKIDAAIDRGMTHATHIFNAMGPVHHREPGVAGRVLSDDRMTCDLICDGVHVHPAMVRIAARAKGEKLMLITDRVTPPAEAAEWPAAASFGLGATYDDGTAIRLADGSLAGSNLTLDRALRNAQGFGAMSRLEAIAAVTLRPAKLLGIESERGTLRPKARADFAILDEGDQVCETWIAGERVWGRE
jgi:N-acetylglucosamine-6-phosphate deacetylase